MRAHRLDIAERAGEARLSATAHRNQSLIARHQRQVLAAHVHLITPSRKSARMRVTAEQIPARTQFPTAFQFDALALRRRQVHVKESEGVEVDFVAQVHAVQARAKAAADGLVLQADFMVTRGLRFERRQDGIEYRAAELVVNLVHGRHAKLVPSFAATARPRG